MLLTKKLPKRLGVFDKSFEIETSARFWINISVEYEKLGSLTNERVNLLLSSVKDKESFRNLNERYKKRLLERIGWFFSCDIFKNKKEDMKDEGRESLEKLYDFEKDSADITAAFQEAYKIDLTRELDTMHWWRFMALFTCLPSSTRFVSYKMHYRMLTANSKEYKNLDADSKKIVDRIKKSVSLEDESYDELYFEESIFEKIEREIKNKQEEDEIKHIT